MDDHFWPAVYPGLVVGVLVAAAMAERITAGVAGALAGLAGAVVAQFAILRASIDDDLVETAILIGAAACAAYGSLAAIRAWKRPPAD